MATLHWTAEDTVLAGYPQLGVVLCDESGRILAVSQTLARWTGESPTSFIGHGIEEWLTVRMASWLVVGAKSDSQCQLPLKHVHGILRCRGRRQEVSGVVALVARANCPAWATVLWPAEIGDVMGPEPLRETDLSECARIASSDFRKLQSCWKTTKRQLARVRAKLKRALRTKQQFLSLVSHELRTPIHGTLGMLDLLASTPLSVKQRHYVHVAQRTSRSLLDTVNDLIELTDLRSGGHRPVRDRCDLPALLEQVGQSIAKIAQETGLDVYWLLDPSACVAVVCEHASVAKLARILVANASRFEASGSVMLRMRLVSRGPSQGRLYLTVTDTTPGAAAALHAPLTCNQYRKGLATRRPASDLGLELNLCSELTKKLYGRLRIRSVVESGSIFQVVIPVAIAERYAPAQKNQSPLNELRVWDSRSDTMEQRHLQRCLQYWGAQWRPCAALEEAAEAVYDAQRRGLPAVLVVDHTQQRRLGLYRAGNPLSGVPVLTTSAKPVEKPGVCGAFDTQQLYDRLLNLAKGLPVHAPGMVSLEPVRPPDTHAAGDPTAAGESIAVNTSATTPRLRGNVLVVEDNPVNQLYLTELLKLMGCSCHVAGDGKAAIQAADSIAFDLVLLDCQIPEMDGFSVAYHIRQRHGSSGTPPSVPIVGVTATCDEPSRRRAVLSGMTEIVAKPIEGEELRALLMKYLPLASETPADA